MATPYADPTVSHQGTPYTYTPPNLMATTSQMATPDPSQYASSSTQPVQAAPAPVASSSQSQPAQPTAQSARQAAEEARKDRTLAEFLLMLDDYEPLVCVAGPFSPSAGEADTRVRPCADSERGDGLLPAEGRVRVRGCPAVSWDPALRSWVLTVS